MYQLNVFLDLISSWCILEFKISSRVLCIYINFMLLVLGCISAGDYLLAFMMPSGFLTWWKRILRCILFLHAQILSTWKSLLMVVAAMKLKDAWFLEEKLMPKLDRVLKNRDVTLPTKVCGFFSSHVWMWELDHKEGCTPKNWCF